uniref:Glucosyltransferase n=1 Tax=Solanum tuberosum TaxID=4113 RepID=M1CLQ0_SOLTU
MAEKITSKSIHGQNIVQEETRGGATVDEGWSVGQNGPKDVEEGAIVDEGGLVDQNIAQDVGGKGGSVEHPLPKNHTIVKLLTPPLLDNAQVAMQDNVNGEVTTDVEGGGSVGHPLPENHTIAKFLTPPLQDDTRVAVVMVPLPAQGHLNQLLHLSRLISMYNIQVLTLESHHTFNKQKLELMALIHSL